jgi:hypothetical protein
MGSLGHHDHLTHHGVQTETQLRHDLNKTANGPWFYVAKCRGLFFVTIRFFAGSITMRSLTSDHLGPYLDNHVASGQSSCVQEDRRTDASDASGPEDAELPGSADSCHGPTARSTPTAAFEACTLYTAIQGRTDVSACHHDFISNSVPSHRHRTQPALLVRS